MRQQAHFSQTVETVARWYVAAMLGVYGLGKMMGGQFHRHGQLPESVAKQPVENLGGFDLAWTFFGYSQAYILFIGLSQVIGALLLLGNRTKLLGVAILMPILLNIIVIDAVFGIHDAMMGAIFYGLLLCLIVCLNWEKVRAAFRALTQKSVTRQRPWKERLMHIGLAVGVFVVFFFLETLLLKMAGFSRI